MENENNPIPQAPQNYDTGNIILDIKANQKDVSDENKNLSFEDLFKKLNNWVILHSPVPLKDKLLFFELFASVVNAGIPISEALQLVQDQIENDHLKIVVANIHKNIRDGQSLADSMAIHSDIFDDATCSIIHAGEKSGKLTEVLKELVSQYTQMSNISKKVKSVMMYPIIIIVVMVLLTIVILIFVVPKLLDFFGDAENLPLPTRMLINGNKLIVDYWYLLLGGLLVFMGTFMFWKRTTKGAFLWSNFMLSFPVIKDFIRRIVLSRFARIFSFLLSSGVPIIEGLKISAHATGNPVYKRKLLLTAADLSHGIEISENFADDERLFPRMLVSMLSIGEKTASMGPVLEKLSDYYDEELDRKISTISKLMEPAIMIMMAGGAVFLILAIYLPILQLNDKVIG
jgi:type IV pilus assembly protein PilC